MVKFSNEIDICEKDTRTALQRCAWCQEPAQLECQTGLVFCNAECRGESLKFGYRYTYLAALEAQSRITTFSCGKYIVPVRNVPWLICDRLSLYRRRHELLATILSAGIAKRSMLVLAAAATGMLIASYCVDDVRERCDATHAAINAVVGLMHRCGDAYDRDGEAGRKLHDQVGHSLLFIVAGVVKGARSLRLHADSSVLLQYKVPDADGFAVKAIAESTELNLSRNSKDGRLDPDIKTVQPNEDYFLDTTGIAQSILLQESGDDLPPESRFRIKGERPHKGRCLFLSRRNF